MNHTCCAPDCNARAELLPQLFVPASSLSLSKYDGCLSTMGSPMCKKHFHKLAPADFLKHEEVRASIASDFHRNRAIPSWNNAKIYSVRPSQPAWKTWELMEARQSGKPN